MSRAGFPRETDSVFWPPFQALFRLGLQYLRHQELMNDMDIGSVAWIGRLTEGKDDRGEFPFHSAGSSRLVKGAPTHPPGSGRRTMSTLNTCRR